MTALSTLARLLGIRPELAEDAIRSERAAKVALTRRSLMLSAGAMAAGTVFSFGAPMSVFEYVDWKMKSEGLVLTSGKAEDLIELPRNVSDWAKVTLVCGPRMLETGRIRSTMPLSLGPGQTLEFELSRLVL